MVEAHKLLFDREGSSAQVYGHFAPRYEFFDCRVDLVAESIVLICFVDQHVPRKIDRPQRMVLGKRLEQGREVARNQVVVR